MAGVATMKRNRIPKRVNVGTSMHVDVILAEPKLLADLAGDRQRETQGLWLETREAWPFPSGKAGVIYIDKRLPISEQWETLRHELLHALHDILHWRLE